MIISERVRQARELSDGWNYVGRRFHLEEKRREAEERQAAHEAAGSPRARKRKVRA